MSLCPLSWRNTKRLARETGLPLVAASAHSEGDVLGVDIEGDCHWIYRRGKKVMRWEAAPGDRTTTSVFVKGDAPRLINIPDEWAEEIAQRMSEILSETAPA